MHMRKVQAGHDPFDFRTKGKYFFKSSKLSTFAHGLRAQDCRNSFVPESPCKFFQSFGYFLICILFAAFLVKSRMKNNGLSSTEAAYSGGLVNSFQTCLYFFFVIRIQVNII